VVFEVPGAFTKRHRKNASQRGKSDGRDARAIAEVVLRALGEVGEGVEVVLDRPGRERLVLPAAGLLRQILRPSLHISGGNGGALPASAEVLDRLP